MNAARRPLAAVIPVKALDQAKGRLAPALSARKRRALMLYLLERTVRTAQAAGIVHGPYVVSPDPDVLAVAAACGAEPLTETTPGHNAALEQARKHVLATWPGAALLVIAADLPSLTSEDVAALGAELLAGPTLTIAPDQREEGTNVLGIWPADALPFRFGPASFQRHVAEATRRGLVIRIHRSPGTAFDLDVPEDLLTLPGGKPGSWPV